MRFSAVCRHSGLTVSCRGTALQAAACPCCRCCQTLAPSFEARCGCNPDFLAIRDAMQYTSPALTSAYLAGIAYIFALACMLPDTSCP